MWHHQIWFKTHHDCGNQFNDIIASSALSIFNPVYCVELDPAINVETRD